MTNLTQRYIKMDVCDHENATFISVYFKNLISANDSKKYTRVTFPFVTMVINFILLLLTFSVFFCQKVNT